MLFEAVLFVKLANLTRYVAKRHTLSSQRWHVNFVKMAR